MFKHFETIFIITPLLSQIQVEETVSKFKYYLIKQGAEIENYENWGLKKLSYPIKKKKTGYYELLQYGIKKDNAQYIISNLGLQFQRDERIIRFITIKLDKYALAYAKNRRNKIQNTNKS